MTNNSYWAGSATGVQVPPYVKESPRFVASLLKILSLAFALVLSFAILGCGASSDSGDASTGTLEIHLTDHREAIGDFARLDVEIDRLRLHPKRLLSLRRSDWLDLQPAVASADLTQYTDRRTLAIWRGELPSGRFEALHLKLKSAGGELKESAEAAPVADEAGPIRLPFDVKSGETTRIIVDLVVLDMSDHPNRGYEVHVRGYELYYNGALADKVPPG